MKFIEYTLTSEMLCMGERIKKAQFRPAVITIPYSQITGALQACYGNGEYGNKAKDIHAVGYFPFKNEQEFRKKHIRILTHSPRDRAINTSILPLYVEYLVNVEGRVFIKETDDIKDVLESDKPFSIYMGALKSKGFGMCELKRKGAIDVNDSNSGQGELNTRIPIAKVKEIKAKGDNFHKKLIDKGKATDFLENTFGVKRVLKAKYGYLFEPTSRTSGSYILSLFEGSVIEGPEFLLKDKVVKVEELEEYGDALAGVFEEIKVDPKVKQVRYFSNKFLNNVAEGFERHGFEATKAFLVDKRNRRGHYYEAEALLSVIKILEKNKAIKKNRKIGRLIIKTLGTSTQNEGGRKR